MRHLKAQHNTTLNYPTDAPYAYKMNAILHSLQSILESTCNLQHNHIILQYIIYIKDKVVSKGLETLTAPS